MHLYSLSHKQQQGQFVNHHTAWDTVLQRLMSHLATDYLLAKKNHPTVDISQLCEICIRSYLFLHANQFFFSDFVFSSR